MGCCVSKNNSTPPQQTPHMSNSETTTKHSSISKSPPPLEEETVKEVLSETPPAIPKNPSPAVKYDSPFIKAAPLLRQDYTRKAQRQNGDVLKKPFMAYTADELSEVSEICSDLSESVSASTTLTENRENKHELRVLRQMSPAKYKNRSLSGEVNREKPPWRSPGRARLEQSPGRVGPVPGSGYGRRDSGDSSGRRSRSPAMRSESSPLRSGLGRAQSARKTGKSPGLVGPGSVERVRKVDGGKECVDSNKWPPTSNDPLENPLVSLECFIFL